MPTRSKIIKDETISVADVIGLPVQTGLPARSAEPASLRGESRRASEAGLPAGEAGLPAGEAGEPKASPNVMVPPVQITPTVSVPVPSAVASPVNPINLMPPAANAQVMGVRPVIAPPAAGYIPVANPVPPSQVSYNEFPVTNYDRMANTPTKAVTGFLDIMMEGHGFLRPKFIAGEGDIYISQSQIRKFMLREGDEVSGQARMPKDNERYLGLLKVEKVNGKSADDSLKRPYFDDLTPIYPKKQLTLETEKTPISTRIIDLLSPIGFGQRGLIVSPPKAGKTTILKELAHGISANFPKSHLMAVLIGERPEEVTDISRVVKGEVIASNFDEAPEAQTKVAEVALARAKRLVELGRDVIILLDSITRLARAYNLCVNPSGRTLSGGFDPAALYPAKRFLGAARSCEEGGSLTILGTALIETGSRMDDLIYEEFKGTGNMELHLSRYLQEQRVFPAIDIDKSGTRHEELLISADILKKIVTLRHMFSLLGEGQERTSTLIDRLLKTRSNKEFLASLNQG